MRKGITPIIAVILLLLITVSLAGAAWSFLQGVVFTPIKKSFLIPQGGAYCSKTGGATPMNIIKIWVVSTAYRTALVDDDFIIRNVDGLPANLVDFSIQPGETHQAMDWPCGDPAPAGGCTQGYHSVDLGTSSVVEHPSIFCP